MTERLTTFDFMRAAAILIIVACHLHNWIQGPWGIWITYQNTLAVIGLGIFFFISGYLIQMNDAPKIKKKWDIPAFYLKKAKRIYPITWFCAVLSATLVFFCALIIGNGYSFFTPWSYNFSVVINPITDIMSNWFVWVIGIFYFVYPVITKFSRDIWELVGISALIFSGFTVLAIRFNIADIHIFMYYWIFVAGILTMKYDLIRDIPYRALGIIGLFEISILYVNFLVQDTNINILSINVGSIVGCIAILSWFEKAGIIMALNKIANPVQFIAISSFCVYLLQFTILSIASNIILYCHLDLFKEYLFYVAIPILIVIGYYIQHGETIFWEFIKTKMNINYL